MHCVVKYTWSRYHNSSFVSSNASNYGAIPLCHSWWFAVLAAASFPRTQNNIRRVHVVSHLWLPPANVIVAQKVAEICVTNLLKFYLLMTTRKGSAWGGKNGRTSKPEISVSWQCVTIVSHGSLCTLSSRNCASARDLVWFGLLYCRYLRSACALQNKTKRFHVSPFVLFLCICRLYVSAAFLVLFFPPFLSGWHHADS